jgi:small-conductance mechanosensitive channel
VADPVLSRTQQVAAAPFALAALAFPFWMALLLDPRNQIYVGIFLVVSLAVTAAQLWLDRLFAPRVQLALGLALEAIAFAMWSFRTDLAHGPIEKLMWAAWAAGTLSAHTGVIEGLQLRRLLSRALRYAVGIPVAFVAALLIIYVEPGQPLVAAIGLVGTFGFMLIPGRVW